MAEIIVTTEIGKRNAHATRDHTVTIPVVENLPERMYLRQDIGSGQTDDGQPIEIALTGISIVIALGAFRAEGSRQFVVSTVTGKAVADEKESEGEATEKIGTNGVEETYIIETNPPSRPMKSNPV